MPKRYAETLEFVITLVKKYNEYKIKISNSGVSLIKMIKKYGEENFNKEILESE